MKPMVVYYSETGNTEKVAQAVAKGLSTQARRIQDTQPADVSGYDLVVIGTPVQGGSPAGAVLEFISRMPDLRGKKAAAFCTMHMLGDKQAVQILKKALENKGMDFIGSFTARGWSRLVANFGPRIFNRGRPGKCELSAAEEFGRNLLKSIQ